jgi:hypothetical protein
MAITNSLSTATGVVRFLIGDDTIGAGVLPDGSNLTDAQIAYALTQAGSNVKGAAARLCEVLARKWATAPLTFSADGLQINRGDMSKRWSDMAKQLADDAAGGNFGTVTLDRQDAYSVAVDQGGHELERDDVSPYTEV